jgi:hypothetical protein
MSEDHRQEKNQGKKLAGESIDEFCKRLGIKQVNEQGGMEFVPYKRQSKPQAKQR